MYTEQQSYEEGLETDTDRPKAFQIISECHKTIEQIEAKSSLILRPNLPHDESPKEAEMPTALEGELKGLLNHLRNLSSRYNA